MYCAVTLNIGPIGRHKYLKKLNNFMYGGEIKHVPYDDIKFLISAEVIYTHTHTHTPHVHTHTYKHSHTHTHTHTLTHTHSHTHIQTLTYTHTHTYTTTTTPPHMRTHTLTHTHTDTHIHTQTHTPYSLLSYQTQLVSSSRYRHTHTHTRQSSICCKTRGRDTALGRSQWRAAVQQCGKLQPDVDLWFLGTDVNLSWGCYWGNYLILEWRH